MLDSLSGKKNSCLVDGPLGPALDHSRAYFYQVILESNLLYVQSLLYR